MRCGAHHLWMWITIFVCIKVIFCCCCCCSAPSNAYNKYIASLRIQTHRSGVFFRVFFFSVVSVALSHTYSLRWSCFQFRFLRLFDSGPAANWKEKELNKEKFNWNAMETELLRAQIASVAFVLLCVCVIVAHRAQRARGRSTRFLTVSIERHAINTTLHNKLRSSKGSRTKIEMWQSIPVELAWHESLDSMYKYNVSIFSVPRYLIHHKIWCNQITHFYQAIRCIISLCFFSRHFIHF